MSPQKGSTLKGYFVFQPSIFRGYVSFSGVLCMIVCRRDKCNDIILCTYNYIYGTSIVKKIWVHRRIMAFKLLPRVFICKRTVKGESMKLYLSLTQTLKVSKSATWFMKSLRISWFCTGDQWRNWVSFHQKSVKSAAIWDRSDRSLPSIIDPPEGLGIERKSPLFVLFSMSGFFRGLLSKLFLVTPCKNHLGKESNKFFLGLSRTSGWVAIRARRKYKS